MMQVLQDVAAQEGVETLVETIVSGLIQDEGGRVIGVEALQGETAIRVKARRAVVLACGDESGSAQMLGCPEPQQPLRVPRLPPGLCG